MLRYLIAAFFCAFTVTAHSQQSDTEALRRMNDVLYGPLKQIEYFGFIHVHIKNSGEQTLGMSSEDLTDFLKLRYMNNFANVAYRKEGNILGVQNMDRIGSLWCGVWTVGTDFPVAYHVECNCGSLSKPTTLTDEVLGYGNKTNVPESIRQALDSMVSKFAIQFFKTRREM